MINITEEYNNRLQDTINKTNEELTQLTELTKKYQGLREEILASIDEVLKYIEILDEAKNEIETEGGIHASGAETEEGKVVEGEGQRFAKLALIDMEYANYKIQNYNNSFTLPELVELFRNFAASSLLIRCAFVSTSD